MDSDSQSFESHHRGCHVHAEEIHKCHRLFSLCVLFRHVEEEEQNDDEAKGQANGSDLDSSTLIEHEEGSKYHDEDAALFHHGQLKDDVEEYNNEDGEL